MLPKLYESTEMYLWINQNTLLYPFLLQSLNQACIKSVHLWDFPTIVRFYYVILYLCYIYPSVC